VTNGVLNGGTTYGLAAGAHPYSVSFSPDGLFLAATNFGLNNVSVFPFSAGGVLSAGASYALPVGSFGPYFGSFSPNGANFATVNHTTNDVTMFTVHFHQTTHILLSLAYLQTM
jgi:6-phosphogluconolactonase (cycloisomerase 2 family)